MKKIFRFWFVVSLFSTLSPYSYPQTTIEGQSGNYSFTILREVKPPILSIVEGSVRFADPGGNNIIDAGETCRLMFVVENSGLGDAEGLTLTVAASGATRGIAVDPVRNLDVIKVGKKLEIEIPVTANLETIDGTVSFTFKINEPNGFGSDAQTMEVKTLKFVSPMVEVVDYNVTGGRGGNLLKKIPFDLQVLVQNTEYGKAEAVTVNLMPPPNVLLLSGNASVLIPELKPGEKQDIVYSLIVNDLFTGTDIPFTLTLSEKYRKFSKDRNLSLALNQAMAASKIVVDGNQSQVEVPRIEIASLVPPVDKNIPENATKHPGRYALIIGNEDYSSRQPGLSKEVNVDFAENDARIFREYAIKTLGVPEKQTRLLINATSAEIKRGLNWISDLARLEAGNAELLFYYSGHGLPDETTRQPYLVPVDVAGMAIHEGISLNDVYQKLTEHPARRVTVFNDACFSGGARNQPLMAMKLVKIKPKTEELRGNIVVFTSSSGDESSGVDREKQHGYFTWALLWKFQQTKGDITYKEMGDYLIKNVARETTLVSKPQTPQSLFSPDVQSTWESWIFK